MKSTPVPRDFLQDTLSLSVERGRNDPKYLHKHQDIYFYDHVEVITNGRTKCSTNAVQHNIPIIRELIAGLYFFPLSIYEIEDESNPGYQFFNLDIAARKLTAHMIKLSKRSKSLKWKIISKSCETYLEFVVRDSEQTKIDLYITRFNEESKVCTFIPITVRYVENDNAHRVLSHTMYLISKRDRDAEYELKNDPFIKNGCSNSYALNFLDKCVKLAIHAGDADDKCGKLNYSILEMNIFRLMCRSIDEYKGVHQVIMAFHNNSEKMIIESIGKYQDVIPSVDDRSYKYPVVNLSEKEWNFIHKYVGKTYPECCDLRNVLEDPRYGKRLVLKYTEDRFNENRLLLTDYEYFPDEDKVIFYISNFEYTNISSFIKVTVEKVSKYTGKGNIVQHEGYIKYIDGIFNLSSVDNLFKYCPSLMFIAESLEEFMMDLISLMIILYDRPQRIKCVKSVKKNRFSSSSSNTNSVNRTNNDVTIERVLVASRDVTEYIRSMGGSGKDREYVLESWERRGHYRRVPGTDRSVWIEPTTCSRHLPLVEKVIEIKL